MTGSHSDTPPCTDQYYIVSVMHTQRSHRYITVWRPDNRGYAWPLSWAGKYDGEKVRSHLGYYNDGHNNVAARAEVIDGLAIKPAPGQIDGDAGPVVPNNAESWRQILGALVEKPSFKPRPEYRGKRRAKAAA